MVDFISDNFFNEKFFPRFSCLIAIQPLNGASQQQLNQGGTAGFIIFFHI